MLNMSTNTAQTAVKPSRRPRMPVQRPMTPRAATRRFNGLILKFSDALRGSRPTLSAAEVELVRQAALMAIRSQQLQIAIIQGEQVDGDELIRTSSEARRLARMLGLKIEPATAAPASPPAPRGPWFTEVVA